MDHTNSTFGYTLWFLLSNSGCDMPRDLGCVHVHVWVTSQQRLYLMLGCRRRCHVLSAVRDALPYDLSSGDLYSDSVGSPRVSLPVAFVIPAGG